MSLPKYKSHKIVRAAIISSIDGEPVGEALTNLNLRLPNGDIQGYGIDDAWIGKHTPKGKTIEGLVGGYFVVYEDGYESWSPAEAFEAGYNILEPTPPETENAPT